MATIVAQTFLTLDGVMQGPGAPDEDRGGGFAQGGWLVPYADEDMARLVDEGVAQADGFLLGRRTYEVFAAAWPRVTDPEDLVARQLNGLPKYVASRTLTAPRWHNTHLLGPDVVGAVRRLKQEREGQLQIHGSGTLVRALMAEGLVDEFRLWHHPVVLGSGTRLFEGGVRPTAMELVEVRTTGAGVVHHVYRRSPEPPGYGSFTLEGTVDTAPASGA